MHAQQRRDETKLHREVAVAHGVHRVLRYHRPAPRVLEAERCGNLLAVERQRGASQRAATQRTDVHTREGVEQPLAITLDHLNVCQQVVREVNRLRPLQVCVAGDDDIIVRLAKRDERLLQRAEL